MSFTDKTLECSDCGSEFVFTAGEQEFYAQKGFTNEPRRCPNCRQNKKQQRFDSRGSREGGREFREFGGRDNYSRDQGGRSSFGGRAGGQDRELFEAVCAECGRTTTVPFKPTQGRPVYCRDCFQKQRTSRW